MVQRYDGDGHRHVVDELSNRSVKHLASARVKSVPVLPACILSYPYPRQVEASFKLRCFNELNDNDTSTTALHDRQSQHQQEDQGGNKILGVFTIAQRISLCRTMRQLHFGIPASILRLRVCSTRIRSAINAATLKNVHQVCLGEFHSVRLSGL